MFNFLTGKMTDKAAEVLAEDMNEAWESVVGRKDPVLEKLFISLEQEINASVREINKLNAKINKLEGNESQKPFYLNGAYYFGEKGPYCVSCYDKKRGLFHLKEINLSKNIKIVTYIISYIIFVPFLLFLFNAYIKNDLNQTNIFNLVSIIVIAYLFILIPIYFIIRNIKYKQAENFIFFRCRRCKKKEIISEKDVNKYNENVFRVKNSKQQISEYKSIINQISQQISKDSDTGDSGNFDINRYSDVEKLKTILEEGLEKVNKLKEEEFITLSNMEPQKNTDFSNESAPS